MIHADHAMIQAWAKACQQRYPGIRIENWRMYVRAVIAAINCADVPPASADKQGNSDD